MGLNSLGKSLKDFYKNSRYSGDKISVSSILDPVTGEVTFDQERILQIFRDNHASKTEDKDVTEDEETSLVSEKLQNLANKYSIDLSTHFPRQQDDTAADYVSISLDEVRKLIFDLKRDTCPGKSGTDRHVMVFFWKFFPRILHGTFEWLINNPNWEDFDHCDYLKKRKIIFLPKKRKDISRVENYRPISLLETKFKLVSKYLTSKIEKGVYRSVSPNQFGFVPTRKMSTCSLTLISLINALKAKFPGSFILFADIRAAFDCAKPSTIHALLSLLYPNSPIPLLIARLNKGGIGEVSMNGLLSEFIRLTKGTGQGDPASTVKFLILHALWLVLIQHAIETSNDELRQLLIPYRKLINDLIPEELADLLPKGVPTPAFADDSALVMRIPESRSAFNKLEQVLSDLEEVTGLSVNPAKSEVLLIKEDP